METVLERFKKEIDSKLIETQLAEIQNSVKKGITSGQMKDILSYIDLTSLNTADNEEVIINLTGKVNGFSSCFPGIPNVAAICTWPSLVETVKRNLNVPGVQIAAVAGGFPSSQTFLEVKRMEAEKAIEAGAGEIDVVIPVGNFLAGDYITVAGEINDLKRAVGEAHLKVILEVGQLGSESNIRDASILAMQAGADFIKTSTGKTSPAATYRSVYIMADAILDFYRKTGKITGLKPAGGIVEPEDAAVYLEIVNRLLGEKWLTPRYFRIGASRLANNLLTAINRFDRQGKDEIIYF